MHQLNGYRAFELNQAFLLMELCSGGSLAELLQRRAAADEPLSMPLIVGVFVDMCTAVAHMHAQGLAHRDVKPENFLLSEVHTLSGSCVVAAG